MVFFFFLRVFFAGPESPKRSPSVSSVSEDDDVFVILELFATDDLAVEVQFLIRFLGLLLRLLEQCVVELLGIRAVDGVAARGDFADVAFEDATTLGLLAHLLSPTQVGAELSSTLLQGEFHLLADLVVVGDGFLRFTREGNPDAGHVHENDQRSDRQPVAGLRESVVLPGRLDHGLEG